MVNLLLLMSSEGVIGPNMESALKHIMQPGPGPSRGVSATNTKSPSEPFPTWMIHATSLPPPRPTHPYPHPLLSHGRVNLFTLTLTFPKTPLTFFPSPRHLSRSLQKRHSLAPVSTVHRPLVMLDSTHAFRLEPLPFPRPAKHPASIFTSLGVP